MTTTTANSLRVSRIIQASPDTLFQAWTDPQHLAHWWRMEGDGWSPGETSIDLRVGGRYRLGMTAPDGQTHLAFGEYREVKRPERLVFTWDWEKQDNRLGETIVTIEFKSVGDGATEVVLTHEGFGNVDRVAGHERGWMQLLTLVERHVTNATA